MGCGRGFRKGGAVKDLRAGLWGWVEDGRGLERAWSMNCGRGLGNGEWGRGGALGKKWGKGRGLMGAWSMSCGGRGLERGVVYDLGAGRWERGRGQ